mmetsp:Transcript_9768/g.27366  ORF Transcript_9768/g.27366 Transcript_9768/m.27366 type:complete len:293 (-) Transcript_9768:85-963(-)
MSEGMLPVQRYGLIDEGNCLIRIAMRQVIQPKRRPGFRSPIVQRQQALRQPSQVHNGALLLQDLSVFIHSQNRVLINLSDPVIGHLGPAKVVVVQLEGGNLAQNVGIVGIGGIELAVGLEGGCDVVLLGKEEGRRDLLDREEGGGGAGLLIIGIHIVFIVPFLMIIVTSILSLLLLLHLFASQGNAIGQSLLHIVQLCPENGQHLHRLQTVGIASESIQIAAFGLIGPPMRDGIELTRQHGMGIGPEVGGGGDGQVQNLGGLRGPFLVHRVRSADGLPSLGHLGQATAFLET